jgi:phage baseplate assembly protein W
MPLLGPLSAPLGGSSSPQNAPVTAVFIGGVPVADSDDVVPAGAGFFGQGVSYPLAITTAGRLKTSSGLQSVADAMSSIVQTAPGERPMQMDYGAATAIFEPLDTQRQAAAIERNVAFHEPRVTLGDISIEMGQTASDTTITVVYTPIGDANPQTLTAPFFVGPPTTSAAGT